MSLLRVLRVLGVVAASLSALATPVEAGPVVFLDPPCRGATLGDPVFCVKTPQGGAGCLAYGLLVVERDASGLAGDVTHASSESRAFAAPGPAFVPAPATPLEPPGAPQASAAARQAHVVYRTALATVASSTVFSECKVAAGTDPAGNTATHAYGRGGVEELVLSSPLFAGELRIEIADFEVNAYAAGFASASTACDLAQLDAIGSTWVGKCAPPWTGAGLSLGATVAVTLNEVWGPVFLGGGQWGYEGAAVHVHVEDPIRSVDIYVGYVVTIVSSPFAGGPAWIPNGPCVLPWPAFCDL